MAPITTAPRRSNSRRRGTSRFFSGRRFSRSVGDDLAPQFSEQATACNLLGPRTHSCCYPCRLICESRSSIKTQSPTGLAGLWHQSVQEKASSWLLDCRFSRVKFNTFLDAPSKDIPSLVPPNPAPLRISLTPVGQRCRTSSSMLARHSSHSNSRFSLVGFEFG